LCFSKNKERTVFMAERSLMIKGLMPGLVERGRIKIGIKGEWKKSSAGKDFQLPQKLDHFVVTLMYRNDKTNNFEKDEDLHKMLGPEPTEIPIVLLFDDIELNFQTRYCCYRGQTMMCYGDGETGHALTDPKAGTRTDRACVCEHQDPKYTGPDKCKINGTLSCMIDKAGVVGGVWKFRTTSYNSVVGIISSLTLLKRITGGALAGVPLMLTLQPKTVSNPLTGANQGIYVVGIEFRGTVQTLQAEGHRIALENQKHQFQIAHIETEAKLLLAKNAGDEYGLTPAEIIEEWYPEEVCGPDGKRLGNPDAPPALAKPEAFEPLDKPAAPAAGPSVPEAPAQPGQAHAPAATPDNKPAQAKRGRPAKAPAQPAQAPAPSKGPFKTQAEIEAAAKAALPADPDADKPAPPLAAPVGPEPDAAQPQAAKPAVKATPAAPPVGGSLDLF
jgi:hypothetical protein